MSSVHRARSRPFVPARYYDVLVTVCEERWGARAQLLRSTGIDPELLAADDGLLRIEEVQALVLAADALDRNKRLAFMVGTRLQLPSHGAIGLAGMTAPSFGTAIDTASHYFALVSPLGRIVQTRTDTHLRLELAMSLPLDPQVQRFHGELFLGSVYAQGSFLLGTLQGRMPDGFEVDLPYRLPDKIVSALATTNVRFQFAAERLELRVPVELLSRRLPLSDEKAHAAACRACDVLLTSLPSPDRLSLEVSQLLEKHGPPFPELELVAKQLGLSGRTLRRKLLEEGESFRALVDHARLGLAERWLQRGERSILEIGTALGYSDAANFARAFRRTRGISPQTYAKKHSTQPR